MANLRWKKKSAIRHHALVPFPCYNGTVIIHNYTVLSRPAPSSTLGDVSVRQRARVPAAPQAGVLLHEHGAGGQVGAGPQGAEHHRQGWTEDRQGGKCFVYNTVRVQL